MKVLLINGSPKEKGCTYTALKEVEKQLNINNIETEIMWIGNAPISGCIGCGSCLKTGKCFIDDKVNEFLEKVPKIDGFVFGSLYILQQYQVNYHLLWIEPFMEEESYLQVN